jgi:hypothetical protein
MHARWVIGLSVLGLGLGAGGTASADPQPEKVDAKPFRDKLHVYQDAQGGTYVVVPRSEAEPGRVFYGLGTKLYEQLEIGNSSNGDEWSISTWSPRVAEVQNGEIRRGADGVVSRWCGDDAKLPLTERTGPQAAALVSKAELYTPIQVRQPLMLARDDRGTYYYVDHLAKRYGGKGQRVFIGKRGAMVQVPLVDVANDSGGTVYSTKRGELRLVVDRTDGKRSPVWFSGEKGVQLVWLDVDADSPLIFRGLGVYGFTGNICEDL